MSDQVISVEDISKRYRIGVEDKAESFVDAVKKVITYPFRNLKKIARLKNINDGDDDSVMWALRDINFDVDRGEVLGIIGHNGAGKSTLLKILSRITDPTTGRIKIKGRVSSLLEVGTGFHAELTGRDNVYMNGTILGMTKKEIDAKFDEIVAFSGVKKYIDTPVKFYSSGMQVRLAFAVAAHLDPEILVIDEVLAVGDLAFQEKCLNKMNTVSQSGRTILFVSHDMVAVEGLCDRCMLLKDGQISYIGDTDEAIQRYRQYSISQAETRSISKRADRDGGDKFRFTGISFNRGKDVYTCNPLVITIHYYAAEPIDQLHLAIKISRNYREIMMTMDNRIQGKPLSAKAGHNRVEVKVPRLDLMPNKYLVDLWAGSGAVLDRIFNTATLTVLEQDVYGSGIMLRANQHGIMIPPACSWTQLQNLSESSSLDKEKFTQNLPEN